MSESMSFFDKEGYAASWKENSGNVLQACVAVPCFFVGLCSIILLARTVSLERTQIKEHLQRHKHGHRHDERTSLMGHNWDRQQTRSPSLTGSPTVPRFVPLRPLLQIEHQSQSHCGNYTRFAACAGAAACTAIGLVGVAGSLLCADWLVGDDDWHMGLFEGCDVTGLLPYLHVCAVSLLLIDEYTEHMVAALMLLLVLGLGLCVLLLSVFAVCGTAKVAAICQTMLMVMAALCSLALVAVGSTAQFSVPPGLWVGPCYVSCSLSAILFSTASLLAHMTTSLRPHTHLSDHRKVLWRRESVISGRGSYTASHQSSKASYMPCSSDSEESDDFYPIDPYRHRHAREPQRFL